MGLLSLYLQITYLCMYLLLFKLASRLVFGCVSPVVSSRGTNHHIPVSTVVDRAQPMTNFKWFAGSQTRLDIHRSTIMFIIIQNFPYSSQPFA